MLFRKWRKNKGPVPLSAKDDKHFDLMHKVLEERRQLHENENRAQEKADNEEGV